MPDFSALGDLAKKSPEKVKAGWEPPRPTDFGSGRVLSFDQSLTATGWVDLCSVGYRLEVLDCGTINIPGGDRGVEASLMRGVDVFNKVCALMAAHSVPSMEVTFAHESPPNPSQVKGGGTSSLMAAQAVRCAASAMDVDIEMLGAQPGKKLVCGNANADKKTAHAGLKEHVFPWLIGSEKVTNEAQRDALIVALLLLSRRAQ